MQENDSGTLLCVANYSTISFPSRCFFFLLSVLFKIRLSREIILCTFRSAVLFVLCTFGGANVRLCYKYMQVISKKIKFRSSSAKTSPLISFVKIRPCAYAKHMVLPSEAINFEQSSNNLRKNSIRILSKFYQSSIKALSKHYPTSIRVIENR